MFTTGLFLYAGVIASKGGCEEAFAESYQPVKPIKKSLYLCDSKFHVEDLYELLGNGDEPKSPTSEFESKHKAKIDKKMYKKACESRRK